MDPARQLATYAQLLSLPADQRAEVILGTVTVMPAPLPRHSRVQRSSAGSIGVPFDDDDGSGGLGGRWILLEVDIELSPHDVVRPDLSGWLRNRLPAPWDQRPLTVRPDWVCEIVSPSHAAHDRITKRKLYASHGVPFYWIVDPAERTLEALRLEQGRWVEAGSYDASATARTAPFDAVELDLSRVFPPA